MLEVFTLKSLIKTLGGERGALDQDLLIIV